MWEFYNQHLFRKPLHWQLFFMAEVDVDVNAKQEQQKQNKNKTNSTS